MHLYSTRNHDHQTTFEEAIFEGLAPDGGLYYPTSLPQLSGELTPDMSFNDIAEVAASALLGDEISENDLRTIIDRAYNFDAPLHQLENGLSVLELFHGPTAAFKDFGARFMAQTMGYFLEKKNRAITILVATSGDTGGAVADAFNGVAGINVVVLYPKGKVSALQEQQLTAKRPNVTALEIDGVFDDCQKMVKDAFGDKDIAQHRTLTTANSINIARLIPQTFYYFYAYSRLQEPFIASVPSGNFGNLTAGLIAKSMGLPITHFIAATNKNDTFPKYLETGTYTPQPSQQTISNAMDIGNPSNFERIQEMYAEKDIHEDISGYSISEEETAQAVAEVFEKYQYSIDPHGAVAYAAAQKHSGTEHKVILETAHPAKFKEVMDSILPEPTEIPAQLQQSDEKHATPMKNDFAELKAFLCS